MGLDYGIGRFDVGIYQGVGGAEGKEGGAERSAGFVVHGRYGLWREVGTLGYEVDVLLCEIPFTKGGIVGWFLGKGRRRG